MTTVGSCEARTRLPELLRAVGRGEVVTITRRGEPIARIVGVEGEAGEATAAVIDRIKAARRRRPSLSRLVCATVRR